MLFFHYLSLPRPQPQPTLSLPSSNSAALGLGFHPQQPQMRTHCCHISLAFLLKLLNFLQTFVGVSIIFYSVWMLDQWHHRAPISPPSAPSPLPLLLNSHPLRVSDHFVPSTLLAGMVSGIENELVLHSVKLPAPWFIYAFMGLGILLCSVTFIGCIAAESINGCCLCFYTLIKTVFVLLEAALVAFIAIDHRWYKDLPFDPTGELESLRSFVEENSDICKWVGIAVVIVQALSLLLAIILRGMISSRRADYDCEDDYENGNRRTREPLLNPQSSQKHGAHSDIWSSRMREKYGLNSSEKHNGAGQSA